MLMGLGHVGRQMIAAKRRLYIEPAALDLSFMTPGSLDGRITFARAGTATYFDSSGNMQVAAANAPRWDYNPSTLVLNGLLIEESRTNIIKNSMLIGAVPGTPGTDPTGWTAAPLAGLTKTIVGTGTEHGIAYVDYRYQGSVATSNQHIYACGGTTGTAFPAAGNQAYVSSLYLSFVAGSLSGLIAISLLMSPYDSGGVGLGTQGGPTFTIGSNYFPTIGDPLTKIRPTVVTYAATPATTAFVQPFYRISLATSVPIDFTVRIGAPQFEACVAAGGYPTSYIPTTTGPITRQADNATMPVSAWYNAAQGSLVGEYTPSNVPNPLVRTNSACGISDNTASNRLILRGQSGNNALPVVITSIGGTTVATPLSLPPITANIPNKLGGSWSGSGNTVVGVLNGSQGAFNNTGLPGAGVLTTVMFGNDMPSSVNTYLNGWLRHVQYWPRALSVSELQSVTT